MKWLENFNNAIAYLENNLDKDISYDEAARIACCSTYYFQRIFTYVTGISLSEYIRRRRMTQAAFELQRTNQKIIDVAIKYGYSSPTAFNRAFQSVHGIAPFAAKNIGNQLNAYPALKLSINVIGGKTMLYRIEKKPAMRVVGVKTTLSNDMELNLESIPKFWDEMLLTEEFKTICNLSNGSPKGILGISVYRNDQDIFYCIASSTNEVAPKGMIEYEIPASTWVIFENDGYLKENVQSIFRRFYTEWLPFSGYDYAGLPDIEVYSICDKKPVTGHSEVWIAIKEKEK